MLVGQIDRTRSPGAAVAIVPGLSEGMFPAIVREDSILSDAERRELRKRSIDIESDSQQRRGYAKCYDNKREGQQD